MDAAQSGAWTNEIQFFEVGSSTYYQGTNYQNWFYNDIASERRSVGNQTH